MKDEANRPEDLMSGKANLLKLNIIRLKLSLILGLKERISSGTAVGQYEESFRKLYKQTCVHRLFAWTSSLKGHALMIQVFRHPQREYVWFL